MRYILPFVLLVLVLVGCGYAEPTHSAVQPPVEPSALTGVVEKGDYFYIPINKEGNIESNIEVIYDAMAKWQEQHPDREIVSHAFVAQQKAHVSEDYTYGVSLVTKKLPGR